MVQDWGLVEFFDTREAEETQRQLHNHVINGQKIRVQYCIPGNLGQVYAVMVHFLSFSDFFFTESIVNQG